MMTYLTGGHRRTSESRRAKRGYAYAAAAALLLALAAGALLAISPPAAKAVHADEPPSVHDVASGLMCQCGCGMTVATCQESMSCSVSDSIVQEIKDQIDEGKGKGEILDYFATI